MLLAVNVSEIFLDSILIDCASKSGSGGLKTQITRRINKERNSDYHLYMGGGVSRCLLANAGDWNPPTVVGLSRPCLELPSIELLLVNELLREEACEAGLEFGGVGVGRRRTAPTKFSGLTPALGVPPSSSSSNFKASSSNFLSSCTTFSLTRMYWPVLMVVWEVIVSSENDGDG